MYRLVHQIEYVTRDYFMLSFDKDFYCESQNRNCWMVSTETLKFHLIYPKKKLPSPIQYIVLCERISKKINCCQCADPKKKNSKIVWQATSRNFCMRLLNERNVLCVWYTPIVSPVWERLIKSTRNKLTHSLYSFSSSCWNH